MVKCTFSIILIGLVGLGTLSFSADLDLEPVALFKCWRALKKLNSKQTPITPSSFPRESGEKVQRIPLFTYLNPSSFENSLQPLDRGSFQWGGLVYRNVEGKPSVLFWPLKKGDEPKSTLHREAILEILKNELNAVDRYLANPKNEKLSLLLEIKENLLHLLSEFKSNKESPEGISDRFFGLLIRAEKTDPSSATNIKSIDFDLNLLGSSKNRPLFGEVEEIQVMLDTISKAISSKVKPEVFRVNSHLLESYLGPNVLKAPLGSRLEKIE